jgi:DNA-binding protein WhiA
VTREASIARLAVRLGGHAAEAPAQRVRHRFTLAAPAIDWSRAPEHCRLAWLRGRFLARGSLSLSGGRAHLEFTVSEGEAVELVARLKSVGMPASWRVRRGAGVVTWKSAETISLFLARIGASAALLELQARSVARTLRGEINRVINAESANVARSVAAAGRQLAAIDALEADGRLELQTATVKTVAAARRETPEASFSEIAERLELHRSTVQRALDRMEALALHDDGGAGLRTRSRPSGPHTDAARRTRPVRETGGGGPSGRGAARPRLA